MITLGAKGWPALWGVPGPEAPALPAPPKLPAPCCAPKDEPWPRELDAPDWPGGIEPAAPEALSPDGSGLLRASVNCVWEDVGVACADPEGELEAPCEGDEVPEVESFFLVEDLSDFALASCSCWAC